LKSIELPLFIDSFDNNLLNEHYNEEAHE